MSKQGRDKPMRKQRPRDRPMSGLELTRGLIETLLICLVGVVIYILEV